MLGVVCCGSYDEGGSMVEQVMRVKAIRLATLRYQLLMRREQGCGCAKCEAEKAVRLETEP